jgi:hypothetical protein
MAERATMPPNAPDDNPTDDLVDAPADLIVRTSSRTTEQHLSRSHKHDHAGEDWTEAQRAVEAEIARKGKQGP